MSWSNEEARASDAAAPLDRVDGGGLSPKQVVDLLRRDLVEISEGKLAESDVEPGGHLFDYGYLDSLTAVTFLARIEQRFGVVIEDLDLLETLTTLDAIATRVRQGA